MNRIGKGIQTFRITTLGCKVNQCESEAIAQDLKASGWAAAPGEKDVELCVVNTCAVTRKACMQSRQAVRRAIRSSPGARIVVTGCYAQVETDEIKQIKGVHFIVGHAHKHHIPELVAPPGEQDCTCPATISSDIREAADFTPIPLAASGNRTRSFLKIQDGCNAFCTYCVVPYARGRSRSMPPENVLENIKQLKKAGYREVVLSGIHLGCYGLDLSPKTNLFSLLKRLHGETTMDRIRLSAIDPHELSEDILRLVADSGCFCPHFHIPLQSGDDLILKQMHRPYTRKYFKDLVQKIHQLIPDAAIGVDTLIGFPGETAAAFENTYLLIRELPVSYLHVFPFSARKQTPADSYPDKVNQHTIKDRCRKMRELGDFKRMAFYRRFLGKKVEVLVEGKRDAQTGCLKGFTPNHLPVLIAGEDGLINTIVSARIDGLNGVKPVTGTICE